VDQDIQSYGLDGNYPDRLQPQLLDLYQAASKSWHEWLGVADSSDMTSTPPLSDLDLEAVRDRRGARLTLEQP